MWGVVVVVRFAADAAGRAATGGASARCVPADGAVAAAAGRGSVLKSTPTRCRWCRWCPSMQRRRRRAAQAMWWPVRCCCCRRRRLQHVGLSRPPACCVSRPFFAACCVLVWVPCVCRVAAAVVAWLAAAGCGACPSSRDTQTGARLGLRCAAALCRPAGAGCGRSAKSSQANERRLGAVLAGRFGLCGVVESSGAEVQTAFDSFLGFSNVALLSPSALPCPRLFSCCCLSVLNERIEYKGRDEW